jgi:pimeloyl-ACP methyl ester carboxylesterase
MALRQWLAGRALRLGRELVDSGHAAVYVRQLLRGNRIPAPVTVRPASPRGREAARAAPPVVLIHGYLATRGSLHLLETRLADRGHLVLSYRLGLVNLGNIRASAALIARKVESLVAQTGIDRVDIVGHSMGGLVGLYYVKRLGGGPRVRKLVLLGTPVTGTWSAMLGLLTAPLGRASVQLLPASAFLRELREGPLPDGVEVVSVAGDRDYMAPVESTMLSGVRHVSLPTGHSGLLVEEAAADLVDGILRGEPDGGAGA